MPWLSAKKLYTKSEMMRALLRAGQFAHIKEADLSKSLDELHNTQFRYSTATKKHQMALMEDCVPEILVSLSRKHSLEPMFKPHVYRYINDEYGCLCAMCFSVTNVRYATTAYQVRDALFWTPSIFGMVDFEYENGPRKNMKFFYEYPSNWCRDCEISVYNSKPYREFRKHMWDVCYNLPRKQMEIEQIWATLRALPFCIQNKPQFVQRISSNKSRFMRFDPRKKNVA